ncbi:MAG: hypothetical protein V4719_26340 [Planctomycetota bacterium]
MSTAAGLGTSSWPSFNANRYQSDGGFSLGGLIKLTAISCLTGAVVGLLAGFISQWFFLVLVFPLGMGVLIGAAGAAGVKAVKVRMPLVCGAAGFMGGCVAVAAMNGWQYYQFERELSIVPPEIRMLARNFDKLQPQLKELDPPVQEILNNLADNPEGREALAVNGILDFIDLQARRGVELNRAKGGKNGLNLGYIGSYCYWGFELLLIAGIAFSIMRGAAAEPFCAGCEQWKTSSVAGSFLGPAKRLRDSLELGDLAGISSQVGQGDKLVATVFHCLQCGPESPIDIRFEKVKIDGKGNVTRKTFCTATYPGDAIEPVTQLFAAAQATCTDEPESPTATESVKPTDTASTETPS